MIEKIRVGAGDNIVQSIVFSCGNQIFQINCTVKPIVLIDYIDCLNIIMIPGFFDQFPHCLTDRQIPGYFNIICCDQAANFFIVVRTCETDVR